MFDFLLIFSAFYGAGKFHMAASLGVRGTVGFNAPFPLETANGGLTTLTGAEVGR